MSRVVKDTFIDLDRIGSRWEETFDRCTNLLDEHKDTLSDAEIHFLEGVSEKLSSFKDQTFISVRQLNYLGVIERKHRPKW